MSWILRKEKIRAQLHKTVLLEIDPYWEILTTPVDDRQEVGGVQVLSVLTATFGFYGRVPVGLSLSLVLSGVGNRGSSRRE